MCNSKWHNDNVIEQKRYLMYSPPGTGKSSLIAAITNYLKFDVYDLELANILSDADLKAMLDIDRKSITVIEDIDCSSEVRARSKPKSSSSDDSDDETNFGKVSLPAKKVKALMHFPLFFSVLLCFINEYFKLVILV